MKLSHFGVIAPFFPVWGTGDTWQVVHKRTFVCHPGTQNLKNDAIAQKWFNSLDTNFTQFRNSVKTIFILRKDIGEGRWFRRWSFSLILCTENVLHFELGQKNLRTRIFMNKTVT